MPNRKDRKKKDKNKALKHRFAKPDTPEDDPLSRAQVLIAPRGEVKMSEVLLDFIRPYDGTWETEEQLRKLLVVAIVAWNAAISPPDKGEELVQSVLAKLPPEVQEDFLHIVVELIERKQRFFANNTRLIIDYKLTMTPGGPQLLVASTLDR